MMKFNKEDYRQKKLAADALEQVSDEELLLEYCSTRSQLVFSNLVKRYERELFNYLRRYLGSTAMAEDAFQGTFLQVHLKCDSFEEGRRFRPWLYTVATNQAIDLQRRNKRHQHVSLDRRNGEVSDLGVLMDLLVGEDREPSERFDLQERADWIREEVERLPEQLRCSVDLVYFQGLKYREAADRLGIPVGTVKSRLHSALNRLRDAWFAENSVAASA
jgi:RNA polymerase sigma-70 factor (ECF subfamily)